VVAEASALIERDDGEALVALVASKGHSFDSLYPQLHGRSLLHMACECGKTACCRELLKANADPNILGMADAHDSEHVRLRPLHLAVQQRRKGCVEALLALAQTEVDGQDSKGRTALHVAAGLSDEWSIETLLKKHGDPLVEDYYGKTSLQYAREKMRGAAAQVISDARDRGKVDAHAAGSAGGNAASARVPCLTKSGLEKKKGGYINCKKCGHNHHWHSRCSSDAQKCTKSAQQCRVSATSVGARLPACSEASKFAREDSSEEGEDENEARGREGLQSRGETELSAISLKLKKRKKPMRERHTKPKHLGGKSLNTNLDPCTSTNHIGGDGSCADAHELAESSGSDNYEDWGEEGEEGAEGRAEIGGAGDKGGYTTCGAKRTRDDGLTDDKPCKKERARKMAQDEQALSSANQRRVAQLMEFKARHGHSWVTTDQNSTFYVKGLGGWVIAQRKAYRRGAISDQLVDALEAAGFSWEGLPKGSRFLERSREEGHGGGANGHARATGLWHAHGNEDEDVGEEGDDAADWQDSDEEACHVLDDGVGGRGVWGRDDDSLHRELRCNESDGYHSSALEDTDTSHLNQLHIPLSQQPLTSMTLVRVCACMGCVCVRECDYVCVCVCVCERVTLNNYIFPRRSNPLINYIFSRRSNPLPL